MTGTGPIGRPARSGCHRRPLTLHNASDICSGDVGCPISGPTGTVRGERAADPSKNAKPRPGPGCSAAAADLFAEQGVDAVSVDAVAEAAGRTSGAVYAHFGSKQGLLLALLDSWKDSVRTVLLAEVAVSDSPGGQLAAVWDNVAGLDRCRSGRWGLLEHELWLRAARDAEVADVMRARERRGPALQCPSARPAGRRRSGPVRRSGPTSWPCWSGPC